MAAIKHKNRRSIFFNVFTDPATQINGILHKLRYTTREYTHSALSQVRSGLEEEIDLPMLDAEVSIMHAATDILEVFRNEK